MGIDWNPSQDGTKRPRRLRGNSSASRVGSSGRHSSATARPRHGMALYFREWPSREICVIDTIT
ncbi:hypothetical protein DPMN_041259 [Dreissena polymorpha]|uniref:Uncharacterized protein n=1 Tax=Dreissena polymorpha TaxID=45954 RepID=A0A9D4CYQ8_DREPO|nr:hypothetical protein DPMN_041259 [Dreissena polymorpha]